MCATTNLRFHLRYSRDGDSLSFEKYQQFKSHLKAAKKKGLHSDVQQPYPQSFKIAPPLNHHLSFKRAGNNGVLPPPQSAFGKRPPAEESGKECFRESVMATDMPAAKRLCCEAVGSEDTWTSEQECQQQVQTMLQTMGVTCSPHFMQQITDDGLLERFSLYLTELVSQAETFPSSTVPHLLSNIHRYLPSEIIANLPDLSQFGRKQSKEFFFYAQQGGGVEQLVRKANFKASWKQHQDITAHDVVSFIQVVHLVWGSKQSTAHTELLVPVLNQRGATALPPIKAQKDLRSMITEGKYAFIENLPYTAPIEVLHPDGCKFGTIAYVPILESIAYLFYAGCRRFEPIVSPESRIDCVHRLSQSQHARNILDQSADLHLILVSWQDGYSPLKTKKERLKAWVKTATLCTIDKHHEWMPTVLVGIGLDKFDKTDVEQRFLDDLRALDQPGGLKYYDGSLRRFVHVRVSQILAKGDQPERRSLCGWATNCKHKYGGALGIAGCWEEIYRRVPSCDTCLRALLEERRIIPACNNCLNWDVLRDSDHATYSCPVGYPKSECQQGAHKHRFQRVGFPELRDAADKAHEKLASAIWTEAEAKVYLSSHGLNSKTISGIIEKGKNVAGYRKSLTLNPNNETAKAFKAAYNLDPSRFQKYLGPPHWSSGLSLMQIIPVLMHMLFEGIVKTSVNDLGVWLGKERKDPAFSGFSDGLLEALASLQICWCKPQPFTKKNEGTGWEAEDYLALSRVMPWLYQSLDTLVKAPELHFPPYDKDNHLKCWNNDQCKSWLRIHGLDTSGNDEAVKRRVLVNQTKQGGPPHRVLGKPSAQQSQLLIQSVIAAVSRIMARSVTKEGIHDMHCYILVFLSYYHRWEHDLAIGLRGYEAHNLKPGWMSKPNFMDLMRLSEYFTLFGPLINAWEGGVSGEKFITKMRAYTARGVRKDWHMHAAIRFQKDSSLRWLATLQEYTELFSGTPNPSQKGAKHRYRTYSSLTDVQQPFAERKPLSGFVTTDGNYGICVLEKRVGSRGTRVKKYTVLQTAGHRETKCTLAYHKWQLHTDDGLHNLDEATIDRCLLFLPVLRADGFSDDHNDTGLYTVIAEDWKVLDEQMTFQYPVVESWLTEN